jgi:hypothetical protein
MPHKILNEDWSAYENYKIEVKKNHLKIHFNEAWEVGYLSTLISKHFPHKSGEEVLEAIYSCSKTMAHPAPRKKFIECVVKKLDQGVSSSEK